MLGHFFVRRTGFPFEWVDSLRFTVSLDAVSRYFCARTRVQALRAQFENEVFARLQHAVKSSGAGGVEARRAYDLVKAVRAGKNVVTQGLESVLECEGLRGWFEGWNRAVETAAALRDEASRIFDGELMAMRRRLRTFAENERFQEALFLSSPEVLQNLREGYLRGEPDGRRNRKTRWWERLLISYLQRFCTKNEATSFFGTHEYATAWRSRPGHIEVRQKAAGPPYRSEGLMSFWSAEAIAETVAGDPEVWPYLRPWRNPLCALDSDGRLRMAGRSWTASDLDRRIIAAAEAGRRVSEIRETFPSSPPDEVEAHLRELARRKVLRIGIHIPSQTVQPISWLIDYVRTELAGWPKARYWIEQLEKFEASRRGYGGAALERKIELLRETETLYESVTGKPARRGEGAFYADRTLLYEECYGSLERFDLCRGFVEDFEARSQTIFDMLAARASLYRTFVRAIGARVYDDAGGNGCRDYAGYIGALRRMEREHGIEEPDLAASLRKPDTFYAGLIAAFPDLAADLTGWERQIREIVHAKDGPNVIALGPQDFCWQDTSAFDQLRLFTSPDIMVCAPNSEALERGEYKIVLSEVHASVMLWEAWMLAYPEFPRLAHEFHAGMETLPGHERQAYIIPPRQHRNFIIEYPGYSIEAFSRSVKDRAQVIPFAELGVRRDMDGVQLEWQPRGTQLELSCAPQESLHLAMFSAPIVRYVPFSLGAHTPRIEINGIVYQREKWRIEASELSGFLDDASGFELFLRCQEYRERLGCPEHVFVNASGEVKPFYLNWSNFFLLELLAHLARTNETLTVTEMLPAPEDCWLSDEHGHYMCELRGSCLYTAATESN